MLTPAELIAFEAEVAEAFNRGEIRSPVHLSGGNEAQLIEYFGAHFHPGDWVFSSWRSHYHALLAGVPPGEVIAAIRRNRSITLTFPEHRFVTSAIVGGTLPIALGVALGVKRSLPVWHVELDGGPTVLQPAESADEAVDRVIEFTGPELPITGVKDVPKPHVHCFVGDMTARTGAFEEVTRYAAGHDLPITWVVEDNGKSVLTDTERVWGWKSEARASYRTEQDAVRNIVRYRYDLPWPHSGAGKRVEF